MFKTLFKLKLHWQILIALALAVVAGIFAGKTAGIAGITFYEIFSFFGGLLHSPYQWSHRRDIVHLDKKLCSTTQRFIGRSLCLTRHASLSYHR